MAGIERDGPEEIVGADEDADSAKKVADGVSARA
jgi:hypothetical protein